MIDWENFIFEHTVVARPPDSVPPTAAKAPLCVGGGDLSSAHDGRLVGVTPRCSPAR